MRPLNRAPVRKSKSAGKFRHGASRTKAPNVKMTPMRGGWRL